MNTASQTFKQVLNISPARVRINSSKRWVKCPACHRSKVLQILPTTECKDVVVYCKACKTETVVNISLVPVP